MSAVPQEPAFRCNFEAAAALKLNDIQAEPTPALPGEPAQPDGDVV